MTSRDDGTECQAREGHGPSAVSPDQLIAELHRLGIRHLASTTPSRDDVPLSPLGLVTGLAACPDARVRSALVPLFLLRPDYASAARAASTVVSGQARTVLLCGYSAAVALEHLLADALPATGRPAAPPLPDIFAAELELAPTASPLQRIDDVGRRHAELTGEDVNWRGTYEHAAAAALRCVPTETALSR